MQRYVSSELTHFVGRGLESDEQYALLVKIVREGWLTHPPHSLEQSGNLFVSTDAKFSTNEMFNPQVICFCDIPVDDLRIHMSKYSSFGLALPKDLIVRAAGTPVRYLPAAGEAAAFDTLASTLPTYLMDQTFKSGSSGDQNDRQLLHNLTRLVNFQVLSFMKFYDHTLPDDHPDNYYMEREWRVLGNLQFQLSDVTRIILPREFATRFRRDLPEYVGQITFADLLP